MSSAAPGEARQQLDHIKELLSSIESCGNRAAIEAARGLVQSVLALHRAGLCRMLELLLQKSGLGAELTALLAEDELVGNLLILHDLHPANLEQRLKKALAEAEPHLTALGGRLGGYTLKEGVVQVRAVGLANGPATMAALLHVEDAVMKHAPDVVRLVFSGSESPAAPQAHLGSPPVQNGQSGLVTLRIPSAARHGSSAER